METETTHSCQYITTGPDLYLAFELGLRTWKLGFTIGLGQRARLRTIAARDLEALQTEIQQAKKRFHLPETAAVQSCYEAGRDGFWLHRYLATVQVVNQVVHSASIEVPRTQRRAKTDRLDAEKLLTMLIRYHSGETKVWKVVHPPSPQEEDQRQLHRELQTLKSERTRHSNRLQALLISQGVRLPVGRDFLARLEQVRLWDERPLPVGLHARLALEYEQLRFVHRQILQLEGERRRMIRRTQSQEMAQVRQLLRLRGIGVNTAWLYVMEFFGWRELRNRRQVGALAGLVPMPDKSGESSRELGISKAGNRYIRAVAIELAWTWLRHQPESSLSRWFEQRYGAAGKRARKVGIVALARQLLIALWRYLETGALPDGAQLKG